MHNMSMENKEILDKMICLFAQASDLVGKLLNINTHYETNKMKLSAYDQALVRARASLMISVFYGSEFKEILDMLGAPPDYINKTLAAGSNDRFTMLRVNPAALFAHPADLQSFLGSMKESGFSEEEIETTSNFISTYIEASKPKHPEEGVTISEEDRCIFEGILKELNSPLSEEKGKDKDE